MTKILSVLVFYLFITIAIKADNLTPADTYYKDNISVNKINANAPSLRIDIDDPESPGGGPGGGGEIEEGEGPWTGGNDSPVGDAILPIGIVAISYCIYLVVRKKRRKSKNVI